MAPDNTGETKPDELAKGEDIAAGGFLSEYPRSGAVILVVNAIIFMSYVCWLIHVRQRIFYTQDGVLYLLPILLFLFVFVFILSRPPPVNEPESDKKEGLKDSAAAEKKKG